MKHIYFDNSVDIKNNNYMNWITKQSLAVVNGLYEIKCTLASEVEARYRQRAEAVNKAFSISSGYQTGITLVRLAALYAVGTAAKVLHDICDSAFSVLFALPYALHHLHHSLSHTVQLVLFSIDDLLLRSGWKQSRSVAYIGVYDVIKDLSRSVLPLALMMLLSQGVMAYNMLMMTSILSLYFNVFSNKVTGSIYYPQKFRKMFGMLLAAGLLVATMVYSSWYAIPLVLLMSVLKLRDEVYSSSMAAKDFNLFNRHPFWQAASLMVCWMSWGSMPLAMSLALLLAPSVVSGAVSRLLGVASASNGAFAIAVLIPRLSQAWEDVCDTAFEYIGMTIFLIFVYTPIGWAIQLICPYARALVSAVYPTAAAVYSDVCSASMHIVQDACGSASFDQQQVEHVGAYVVPSSSESRAAEDENAAGSSHRILGMPMGWPCG